MYYLAHKTLYIKKIILMTLQKVRQKRNYLFKRRNILGVFGQIFLMPGGVEGEGCCDSSNPTRLTRSS